MNYFNEQEAIENNAKYHKTCHICGKEFWSTSRQTKYCNKECSDKALKKVVKRNKTRRIRRKAYDANKEINRALSKTYALAHEIAELYKIPKVCMCKDEGHVCKGPLQLHHANLNPFCNDPSNLKWYCNSAHKAVHDKLGDVNMVEVYNRSLDYAGFEEEDSKYIKMIEYTQNEINKAING